MARTRKATPPGGQVREPGTRWWRPESTLRAALVRLLVAQRVWSMFPGKGSQPTPPKLYALRSSKHLGRGQRLSLAIAVTNEFTGTYRAEVTRLRAQYRKFLIDLTRIDPDEWKEAAKQLRLHVGKPNALKKLHSITSLAARKMAVIRYVLHEVDTLMKAAPATKKTLKQLLTEVHQRCNAAFAVDVAAITDTVL